MKTTRTAFELEIMANVLRENGFTVTFDVSKAYTIQMSEEQRATLLEVLRNVKVDLEVGPLEYWIDMLDELPRIEDTHSVTHGFCL